MRGIYDGPTTGRRSIFSSNPTSRARSLEIPRPPSDAAADAGTFGSAPKASPIGAHEQLRLATQTPPRDIPGGSKADGSHNGPKSPQSHVDMVMSVLSRHAHQPSRARAALLHEAANKAPATSPPAAGHKTPVTSPR